MPVEKGPNLGLTFGWSPGEDYWGGPMNGNLLCIDTIMCLYFRSASRATPPGDSVNGDTFLVAANAGDAWAQADGLITVMNENKWVFYTPRRGMRAYLESTGRFIWYNGTKWLDEANGSDASNPSAENNPKQYHVSITVPYQPAGNEALLVLPVTKVLQLPKENGESKAVLLKTSPGYAEITISRNGNAFGKIVFEEGGTDGELKLDSTVTLAIGDRLEIFAPKETIKNFSNIGITLVFNVVNG